MAEKLESAHPLLMVPHVFSFSVVLYTNGAAPTWKGPVLRDALIAALPPGTGVSDVTVTNHAVYEGPQGAIHG